MSMNSYLGKGALWRFVVAVLWVAASTFSTFSVVPSGAEEKKAEFIFAYSEKTLPDVDTKDAAAAMKLYVSELGSKMKIVGESVIYRDTDQMMKDLQAGKIDLLALRALDYLRSKPRSNTEAALVNVKGGKTTSRYVVLVKEGEQALKIGHLRNKRVALIKGDDVGLLFLNTLLLAAGHQETKEFFSSVDEKAKASQAVLSVFFGQADACVIDEGAFKTIEELNPQVSKKLKVLAVSPELVTAVTVFRKGCDEDLKKKVIHTSKTLKNDPRGKQVLLLFKVDDLSRLHESDLDSLKALVNEYDRLKAKRLSKVIRGQQTQ